MGPGAIRCRTEPPQAVVQALAGLLDGFGDGIDHDTALLALGVPAPSPTAGPQSGNGSGAG
ncbi:hypothetical protein ACGFX8_17765 [Streptomyces sp. NPDC048362]|uniref:hypothetical protein n=1 Tax=Streptomyces sp. NPDC048362 TaxID=3365539 RepID=UPI003719E441